MSARAAGATEAPGAASPVLGAWLWVVHAAARRIQTPQLGVVRRPCTRSCSSGAPSLRAVVGKRGGSQIGCVKVLSAVV